MLFHKVFEFLQTTSIILLNSIIDNKMFMLYLEEIFRKLYELTLYLQNQDMNIVHAKQIIKAFIYILLIWEMKAMTHSLCHFPSLEGKEIDCELQTVAVDHLSFLHDYFQARIADLLQLNILLFINFLHTMPIEDVMDQPECVQIELCEVIADEDLIQTSEKNWVKEWLQSPTKYRIVSEKAEPFKINLRMSNLAEKGFSTLLHSFAKHRRSLHLNENSEMRPSLSDLQPRISSLVKVNSHKAITKNMCPKDC